MSSNDLNDTEERWRRKPLFRERRTPLYLRIASFLLIAAVLVVLGWWLQSPALACSLAGSVC